MIQERICPDPFFGRTCWRHPLDVVSVGDVVQVQVVDVDIERERIGLSMLIEE